MAGFNPFDMQGTPIEKQVHTWNDLVARPYDKMDVDAYTRTRVILMNGIENNSVMTNHAVARHTTDPEALKRLAEIRRIDSLHQQMVNWLNPADQSVVETTIGYEQVAVDLTANLAKNEPDPYFKQVLDFALLEDFDHLFRYGCLMELIEGKDPNDVTQGKTEIKPGRATMDEHRHPVDEMRKHVVGPDSDIKSHMNYHTIVSGEQQTMLFYKGHGMMYPQDIAKKLYTEIADVEQQHVSQYEAVGNPSASPLQSLTMLQLCEAYNYYSCMQTESDPRIKGIWEQHCAEELTHFNICNELLKKSEGKDVRQMMKSDTIEPLIVFEPNIDYVNQVLRDTVQWRPVDKEFVDLEKVPSDWASWSWNKQQNAAGVPSEDVTGEAERKGKVPEVRRQMAGVH